MKILKKLLSSAIVFTLAMSTSALADTSSSAYNTPTINGYHYSFTSEVWVRHLTPTTVEAVSLIKEPDTNVPTGYMGGQARLFDSAGNLKASSSMTYNSSTVSAFWVYSPRISTYGQYYAQTIGSFYNGNGYNSYTGYKSPIQTLSSSTLTNTLYSTKAIDYLMIDKSHGVNSKGQTYGSALFINDIGSEPDLISAIGTNGIKGYVKANDLTPKASTVEEAIRQTMNTKTIQAIPLYDKDGTTVLGEFELITNQHNGK